MIDSLGIPNLKITDSDDFLDNDSRKFHKRKEKRESETNKKREGSNFRQLCNYTVKGWEESLDVGKRFRHRLTQRT